MKLKKEVKAFLILLVGLLFIGGVCLYFINKGSDINAQQIIICLVIFLILIGVLIYCSYLKNNQKKVLYIDPITNLGNENFFKEKGKELILDSSKNKYIISFDIEKYKVLNNQYNQETCNRILKQLGENVADLLPTKSIICRISRDLFAAIFVYNGDIDKYMEKVMQKARIIDLGKDEIELNLSCGIYKIEKNDTNIELVK